MVQTDEHHRSEIAIYCPSESKRLSDRCIGRSERGNNGVTTVAAGGPLSDDLVLEGGHCA